MTGAINFGTGGQNINQGSFDLGLGGYNGISLNCAVGYELNWQAGRFSARNPDTSPRDVIFDSDIRYGSAYGESEYWSNLRHNADGISWTDFENANFGEYSKTRVFATYPGSLTPVWFDLNLNSGNPYLRILKDGGSGVAGNIEISNDGIVFADGSFMSSAGVGSSTLWDSDGTTTVYSSPTSLNAVDAVSNYGVHIGYDSYQGGTINVQQAGTENHTWITKSAVTVSDNDTYQFGTVTPSSIYIEGVGYDVGFSQYGFIFPDGSFQSTAVGAPSPTTGTTQLTVDATAYPDEVVVNINGTYYAMPARVI